MIVDKTVDLLIDGEYAACNGFHDDIPFNDVVKIYKNKPEYEHYSRVLIRQW